MATILNNAPYMGFPLSIKRGNPAPVDTTAVWYNKTELDNYAKTGATAYVGQILTLIADDKCEAYMISNAAGTLVKLAQTTASGDLASDVSTLQGQVASLIEKVGSAAQDETAATGLYKEIADVLAVANGKVASVKAADKSITVDSSVTEPTIKVAIASGEDNALELAADGLKVVIPEVTVPEYSMKKLDAATEGMSASYQLTKDGAAIGAVIDIPKDMVVKSGSVQTFVAGGLPAGVPEAGTYIVLVLANTTNDKLYIRVNDLIEYVTSGSAADDMVFINIDPKTHKVTAKITNGSITEAKLAKAVTDKLALASSAIQKVESGTANGTIAVDGTDIAVTGLKSAAYTDSTAYDAAGTAAGIKTALEGADADKADALTIKGAKKYAEEKATAAQSAAETTAKGYIDKLKLDDAAVAKQLVSAVTQTNGQIAVIRRELVADDIPTLGVSKIDGLQGALNNKQDTVTFDGKYNAGTNKAATVSTVNTAVDNLIHTLSGENNQTEIDTVDSKTIRGAKLYADQVGKNTLDSAKTYADSLVGDSSAIAGRVTVLEGKVDVDKVSTAIATAKTEAIEAAAKDAASKDTALKTEILGEGHTGTVKEAYDLANKKTTMTEVEAKGYAVKTEVDTAVADAKKAGTDAQASINTLNNKVGTVPADKTIVQMIADAQKAATYDDSAVKASIKANADAITKLNGADTVEGSVAKTVKDAIAVEQARAEGKEQANAAAIAGVKSKVDAFFDAENVGDAAIDTLKEIQNYISTHGAAADEMVKNIAANKTAISAEAARAKGVEGTLNTAITNEASRAKDIESGLATRLNTLEGADTVNGSVAKTVKDAVDALNISQYAKDADVVKKETGKSLIADTKITKLDGIAEGAQVNVIEKITVNGTEQTPTKKTIALESYKGDGTSIENNANHTLSVKAVSTDLLKQGTLTLVLNGGNASTLI